MSAALTVLFRRPSWRPFRRRTKLNCLRVLPAGLPNVRRTREDLEEHRIWKPTEGTRFVPLRLWPFWAVRKSVTCRHCSGGPLIDKWLSKEAFRDVRTSWWTDVTPFGREHSSR
uniref:(northern house mosquito) hypothetical protein n=1 Tax=Culex pipiens TaxID=7175 RepID=A0A8D8CL65_CULPI